MTRRHTLTSADAQAVIDLDHGGRLASLQVASGELLVTEADHPVNWGAYPMAPWAGRVRRGRFPFQGREFQLPVNFEDHAIHGTVFDAPWAVTGEGDSTLGLASGLGPHWPFGGEARQRITLDAGRLVWRLEVHAAEQPMPAACGIHPWFRRRLGGSEVQLEFQPGFMLERDAEGLPTGRRVPPPPGPWDDTFGEVAGPPRLTWPGQLSLEVITDAPWFVVFTQRQHAVCVEPQTAPPDVLNHPHPPLVEPGRPLRLDCVWAWSVPT